MVDPRDPMEARIPPPPPAALPHPPVTLETLAAEVRALRQQADRMLRLLAGDPLDRQAPAGLVQRQDAQEAHLTDHEERITALEDANTAAAERWGGRAWAALYDVLKLAGAAGLGAWIGRGGTH